MINEKDFLELQAIRDNCEVCNGSGYIRKEEKGSVIFSDCSCVEKISKQLILVEANIPKQYWKFDFRHLTKRFKQENKEVYAYLKTYLDDLGDNIDAGKGFWLSSFPGLAKSSIICYFLREAMKLGKQCYYTKAYEIISRKFQALGDHALYDRIQELMYDVDVFALEEIEKVRLMQEGDMINQLFNELISDLYDSNKVILVSSNMSRKRVLDMYPLHISDRLSTLEYLPLVGKSSGRRVK